jgi:hypothetical protein
VVVIQGEVEASTDKGKVKVAEGQEALLARRAGRPGKVREARNMNARLGWVAELTPAADTVLMSEDFEGQPEGQLPDGWECSPGHWKITRAPDGNRILISQGVERFMPLVAGDEMWSDYDLVLQARGPVIAPIVLYRGFGAHYRVVFHGGRAYVEKRQGELRPGSDEVTFLPQPRGETAVFVSPGSRGSADWTKAWQRSEGLAPSPGTGRWYWTRVEVRTSNDAVRIRGRIWTVGKREPVHWHVEVTDDGREGPLIRAGRIGYFGYYETGHAPHAIDNVRATSSR